MLLTDTVPKQALFECETCRDISRLIASLCDFNVVKLGDCFRRKYQTISGVPLKLCFIVMSTVSFKGFHAMNSFQILYFSSFSSIVRIEDVSHKLSYSEPFLVLVLRTHA